MNRSLNVNALIGFVTLVLFIGIQMCHGGDSTAATTVAAKNDTPVTEMMELQYEKISSLGEGNFGLALLCRRTDGMQIVLKKIIHGDNTKMKNNAQNEAKILSKLDHPNIVRAFQTYRSLNSTYIEMEYMEGGTLAYYITQHYDSPMDNIKIFIYLKQLVDALNYIHSVRSIVHRDIKPANIFLNANATLVKLADFGVAVILENNDMLCEKVGTSSYMAPEILNAQDYSFPVDVWALGCVAFELIERRRCFDGSNEFAAQYKIISGEIPLPKNSIFKELIGRMLTRYVPNRPNSSEVLRLLEDVYARNDLSQYPALRDCHF